MFRRPSSVPPFEYQPSATRPSRPYSDHEISLYAFHCLLVAPTPHFSPSTLESLATSCLAFPYSAWFPLSDCGCVGRQVNARRPWKELPSGQQGYAGKSARAPTDQGSQDSDDGSLSHDPRPSPSPRTLWALGALVDRLATAERSLCAVLI